VLLEQSVEAGLDAAVVQPDRILAPAEIPSGWRETVLDLLHDRSEAAADATRRLKAMDQPRPAG
jgi:cobalamin-dependent methionine synthase I